MTIREEGNVSTDSSRLILQQYPLIRVIVEKQREETHGLLQHRLHVEIIKSQPAQFDSQRYKVSEGQTESLSNVNIFSIETFLLQKVWSIIIILNDLSD